MKNRERKSLESYCLEAFPKYVAWKLKYSFLWSLLWDWWELLRAQSSFGELVSLDHHPTVRPNDPLWFLGTRSQRWLFTFHTVWHLKFPDMLILVTALQKPVLFSSFSVWKLTSKDGKSIFIWSVNCLVLILFHGPRAPSLNFWVSFLCFLYYTSCSYELYEDPGPVLLLPLFRTLQSWKCHLVFRIGIC